MTGGYTILDLGGNVFTVGKTDDVAEGKEVEGIYERIEENNPNKPFLLKNYLFARSGDESENARFVDFSNVAGRFEAAFYVRADAFDSKVTLCFVRVESNDTVKFFKEHKA